MSVPRLATDLISGLSAFEHAIRDLEEEWAPEAPPVTVSMGELGRALIEKAGKELTCENIAEVFHRIERILESGSEAEKDAVATGFLEAVAAAIDRSPDRRWVLDHVGPAARNYLAAWDDFCGLSSDF